MDFLLILLGTQIMLIGVLVKRSRAGRPAKTGVQAWGMPLILLAAGTVFILLGILYRIHRYR